jgi:RNA polymerase sigma factor (sigma-70 family)
MATPETIGYVESIEDTHFLEDTDEDSPDVTERTIKLESTLADIAILGEAYNHVEPRYTPAPSGYTRPPLRGGKDPIRDYINQIDSIPLLKAEEEVELAMTIEAGLYATHKLRELAQSSQEEESTEEKAEYEYDLRRIAQLGAVAKQNFIDANLRLVVSLSKFHGGVLPQSELIYAGNLGLIRAVEKFDYTKGYKFSTYSAWWIRDFMQKANRRQLTEKGKKLPMHVSLDAVVDTTTGKRVDEIIVNKDEVSVEDMGEKSVLRQSVHDIISLCLVLTQRNIMLSNSCLFLAKPTRRLARGLV